MAQDDWFRPVVHIEGQESLFSDEDLSIPEAREPVPLPEGALVVYTDGACSGPVGPGGWAWWVNDDLWEAGFCPEVTAQRMEVQAVVEALTAIDSGVALEVRSDSRYVVNAFSEWIYTWQRKGWQRKRGQQIAHQDLFSRAWDLLAGRPPVGFTWVKGHSGIAGNEAADRAAVAAVRGAHHH